MIRFESYEIPVAYSMIRAAEQIRPSIQDYNPIEKFYYLWGAFNNIYQTISDIHGRQVELRVLQDGSVEYRYDGKVRVPRVKSPGEREQIKSAINDFDQELKFQLINHPSTHFFVYRIPRWHGMPIQRDSMGQELNGVMNVAYTISTEYPVWSPIDKEIYARFMRGEPVSDIDINTLVGQIVRLLYTVRNNLFHGGKRFDDANDVEVIDRAVPLLELIVSAFTR